MSEQNLERCCRCETPTGRAGVHDDSMYTMFGEGPLCEDCYDLPMKYEERIAALESERDEYKSKCEGMFEVGGFEYFNQRLTEERAESSRLRNAINLMKKERNELNTELAATKRECEGLREALKFYADPQVYKPNWQDRPGDRDLSYHAKDALAARDETEGSSGV